VQGPRCQSGRTKTRSKPDQNHINPQGVGVSYSYFHSRFPRSAGTTSAWCHSGRSSASPQGPKTNTKPIHFRYPPASGANPKGPTEGATPEGLTRRFPSGEDTKPYHFRYKPPGGLRQTWWRDPSRSDGPTAEDALTGPGADEFGEATVLAKGVGVFAEVAHDLEESLLNGRFGREFAR
jgi:hypothetical protein